MHHADIIAELKKADYPAIKLANDLGVSRGYVSLIIHNKRRSKRVAKTIAAAINRDINVIWPGVYDDVNKEAA